VVVAVVELVEVLVFLELEDLVAEVMVLALELQAMEHLTLVVAEVVVLGTVMVQVIMQVLEDLVLLQLELKTLLLLWQ
jgi:hypothetical protein